MFWEIFIQKIFFAARFTFVFAFSKWKEVKVLGEDISTCMIHKVGVIFFVGNEDKWDFSI